MTELPGFWKEQNLHELVNYIAHLQRKHCHGPFSLQQASSFVNFTVSDNKNYKIPGVSGSCAPLRRCCAQPTLLWKPCTNCWMETLLAVHMHCTAPVRGRLQHITRLLINQNCRAFQKVEHWKRESLGLCRRLYTVSILFRW